MDDIGAALRIRVGVGTATANQGRRRRCEPLSGSSAGRGMDRASSASLRVSLARLGMEMERYQGFPVLGGSRLS